MSNNIVITPGDGIGKEIAKEARKLIDWISGNATFNINLVEEYVGGASIDKYGTPLSDETLKRINKIKPLEKYVKDILRNRVQILNKKYQTNENLPKLSSVSTITTIKKFNTNNFNPLLYNFDFDSQKSQIYRVDGTDLVINIIPKENK